MNESKRKRGAGVARLAPICMVAATVWLSGCAAGSGTTGRTQYKGDAVWNISAADGAVGRESESGHRCDPSACRERRRRDDDRIALRSVRIIGDDATQVIER